ncbi:RHS repeat-associated core domain-containing protein [Woeseia oceani]|uniref:Teneurin-like YD-shell domain-containing protein n=1 Tax=Woeseia oceani TaxID=1548547 RepID=A0A193LJQ0_9GAMM|nr:RHS repeat-associated core domain-containing protein [Woeseia oceani]ANO52658.1 hypothetical protein BA177_17005 [Woeseia oceani]
MIGEYDAFGNPLQETVWFEGAPVAVLQGSDVYYVHTDHLGTPRAITDSGTVIWRWESDPFGTALADEDPDGDLVNFTFNGRFPGQYFDAETGLHCNYFRTYDPSTGRYLESDPIGLGGGLNTYGYVGGNPLSGVDPFGLYEGDGQFPGPDPGAAAAAMAREAAAAQRQAQRDFERYQELCRYAGGSSCDQPEQGPFNESSSFIGDACEILGATVGLYTAGQGLPMSRLLPPRTYVSAYPPNPAQVQHIFRNAPGHIADTAANRALLQRVASNPGNRVGHDRFGNTIWSRYQSDGSQVWVQTRGGVIQNGGVNAPPPLPGTL